MIGYLLRVLRHHLGAGRGLFLLTIFGVALGVASVLSIQILNLSAVGAFSGAMKAISGPADLTVRAPRGTLDEAQLPAVLGTPGVARAWPVLDVTVALEDRDDEAFLRILGLDVYSGVGIPWAGEAGDLTAALATPGWAAVSPRICAQRGWEVGTRVPVSSGSRRFQLLLGATVDFEKRSPTAGSRLAVMDLGQAQEALGMAGRLHQIDVVVRDGEAIPEVAGRLRKRLGPGLRVVTPEVQRDRTAGLLSAFRLNLTALSLVSLVVGFFLVIAATQATLTRRRKEFGLLRSLGARRGQVLGVVLAEVGLLALLGVAVGVPMGWAAAAANLDVVAGTLSNLYLIQETEHLVVPGWLLAVAAGVGVLGSLAGAVAPAMDITGRHPRELLGGLRLHDRTAERALPLLGAGVAMVALVFGWYALGGHRIQWAGFVLAFGLVLAVPLASPWLVLVLTRRARAESLGFGLGLRSLGAELRSTAFAVAALAVAVTMMVGITVMVDSFRRTVADWVEASVQADIYLTSRSFKRAFESATLDPELIETLRTMPGVRDTDFLRRSFLDTEKGRVLVNGIDLGLDDGDHRAPLMAGPPDAMAEARRRKGVLVSEPYMRRFGVGVGDTLTIPTSRGPVEAPIVAVYRDFSSDAGEITLDLAHYGELFGEAPPSSMALYLDPQVDADEFVDRLKAKLPDAPLWVRSNRTLREEVFKVFDQTFAITRVLQVMALLVATCCIALTLLVQARERAGELALMAALGARPPQIFRLYLAKGVAIGALGLGLGALAGLALAQVLIEVINPAFFGWSLAFHWPTGPLVEQGLTILLAAAVASLYPASRASRTPATELSRDR